MLEGEADNKQMDNVNGTATASAPDEPIASTSALARAEEEQKKKMSLKSKGGRKKYGWQRGLIPEAIIGASTDTNEELIYLMRYSGSAEEEYVPRAIANKRYPQMVIKFYQDRLQMTPYVDADD